jgi:glycosyltransferase 2 family protein
MAVNGTKVEGRAPHGRRRVALALRFLGLAVSLVFAYVAVRGVDFRVAWRAFRESDGWWLLPSLAALAVGVLLRVLRWLLLFSPDTRPGFRPAASALLIGAFFNNVLPARAGEVARVLALRQMAGTSQFEALGTVISERIYDVLSLLVLLFVALPVLPEVAWVKAAAVTAIVLTLVVAAFLLALARWGEGPVRFLMRPLLRLPGFSVERTDLGAASLIRGLTAGRDARLALGAAALTTISWIVFSTSYWFLMLAFHLDVDPFAGLLVLVATNLAMVLPSSPAALGVFEGATQVALSAYGVEPSVSLSYGVLLHFVNFAPYVAVGYLVFHRRTGTFTRGR